MRLYESVILSLMIFNLELSVLPMRYLSWHLLIHRFSTISGMTTLTDKIFRSSPRLRASTLTIDKRLGGGNKIWRERSWEIVTITYNVRFNAWNEEWRIKIWFKFRNFVFVLLAGTSWFTRFKLDFSTSETERSSFINTHSAIMLIWFTYRDSMWPILSASFPIESAMMCWTPLTILAMLSSPSTFSLTSDWKAMTSDVNKSFIAASSKPISLARPARVLFLTSLNGAY